MLSGINLIGNVNSLIMEDLGFHVDSSVYTRADLGLHLSGKEYNNHMEHFVRYGEHMRLIVEEPMWYGKTNNRSGYLFVRKIGSDYVCVPIAVSGSHLSIRSFYIKENSQRVEEWIADGTLVPFVKNHLRENT